MCDKVNSTLSHIDHQACDYEIGPMEPDKFNSIGVDVEADVRCD